ncbi:extracellular calcium-sensing receptor-like [Lissotriton helveticus]
MNKLVIRYYRDVLGMIYAIEEINQTPGFLPNITLGFQIFDSCLSEISAIRGTLELLSGRNSLIPGYRTVNHPALAGIIGETMSSLTVPMARVMGPLQYPQISHSASLPILSDKDQFPSFLRTVPGSTLQNIALARLMGHFGWTWVGMIVSDDDLGLQGGQHVKKVVEQNGGCVAFMEKIHLRYTKEKVLQVVDVIQRHTVKVIIVQSAEAYVKVLLETLYEYNVTGKIWVFSAYFVISPGIFADQAWKILNGSLGLTLYTDSMSDLEEFLCSLQPSLNSGDIFTRLLWEQIFKCQWPQANRSDSTSTVGKGQILVYCSREETLNHKTLSVFELSDLSYTYQSYLAVYAFAHALNSLMSCTPGQGPFLNGTCADINDIQPWQTLHYLKHMEFKSHSGDKIFFDVNGDVRTSFHILNIQISQNEDFRLVKVGQIDTTAAGGREVSINMSAVLWSDGSSMVPRSVCSDPCPPGYRKAAREGEPVCCFDCVPCSPGTISNGTDMISCIQCADSEWSNERRDRCIQKVIEFLTFEEPLGFMITISATSLTLLTVAVFLVFIKYRNTPIVKANNRGLSYLLLIALIFCFLCSFIFIDHPRNLSCMLRQTVFGVIFSISISVVLAKTITVVLAFKATNPNSSARKWLGLKTPSSIVVLGSLVQIVICAVWTVKAPPFPELKMKYFKEKIIFECNEGDTIFFYCMLGYMGLLAIVSFIVAFLSRNLPGSFNEAKLITFSMLVFVSVWISFIPAYLSTRGKYMVAVEVFAILCSSAGLLGCIFFPKCYIILLRPQMNSKQFIVGKKRHNKFKD